MEKPPEQPEEKDAGPDDVGCEASDVRGGSLAPHEHCEAIDEASDESFPASDPPAWTSLRAA